MTIGAEYGGTIGKTHAESTPWWPPAKHPGDDAPNVVVVLFDDLGFSHLNCFGSDMATPNIDKLAENGLRFSNFHVTPLCSPTRAALLTGRNHHTVGMRSIANFNTGYPHMTGRISDNATTMGEVLRDVGYSTFALGKWHLCPMDEASAAGPYDAWPLQRGFDRFYGFLDGETDQFAPDLVYDNHRIDPPATAAEGYHLSEDLVDKAIEFIHDTTSVRPDRPFFAYLAFGATHAPHQAPAEYLSRHRGKYDEGWDVARERWFAKQIEEGLIAPGTQLAPRNPGVEAWEELPVNQKKLAIALQEAFGAFLEHADAQIGRLVNAIDALGKLENTVIVVLADNGASQEGGPFGVLHEMKFFNFLIETPDEAVDRLAEIGGPDSHANYPWGWAQAGNTPFKWYKQNTHEGGVHVPFVMHWPKGISDHGAIRNQFHYITDLAPTIYDIVGVKAPSVYRGYEQYPIAGESMTYAFADANAKTNHDVQYFEMFGHRAMYDGGWKAVTRHTPGVSFDDDVWELYNLTVDPSECEDLSAAEPDRLEEMIKQWWAEAETYGVLPLDDRGVELFGARFGEHSPHRPDRRYTYRPPMAPLPAQSAASLGGRSWTLSATIDRAAGQGGVLYAMGNGNSGLSAFVQNERLVFDYNCFGDHFEVESDIEVPAGRSTVGIRFERTGKGGHAAVVINDVECGTVEIPFVMRVISSMGASVGFDHGLPVSRRYSDSFAFEGKLHRVDIELAQSRKPEITDEASASQRAGMARQ
ncbi:MAG: sulfatase-like hydrolase/transferase [Acidimicrobiales bacterium]